MKSFLPLAVFAIIFASCSTMYKSGQTPDDVYFSPQRAQPAAGGDEYVNMDRNRNSRYNNEDAYNSDDEYLRMKVRNHDRWAMLDNEVYFNNYSPYGYGYGYNPLMTYSPFAYNYYSSPFSSYYNYNMPFMPYYGSYSPYSYYYPYVGKTIVSNSRGPVYNRPRTTNLNIYNSRQYNTGSRRNTYIESNTNNDSYNRNNGNQLRNIFNSNNNNSYQNNSRPAPSSGSSSSGSSSSSAPVRRF